MSFKQSDKQRLITLPQYILPHHFLSKIMSFFTHCENKIWKNLMINNIARIYGINSKEAASEDLNDYPSFNHYFTRALKSGVRPITDLTNGIASPADGVVSQAGAIKQGDIFQAKGKSFTATELLGGDSERATPFNEGVFTTIYLSPKDYHRLHMPIDGTLKQMIHIPGRLFSVNKTTANSVPGLFARNERVACIFDTEAGPMALILVGAIFVSSVETVWEGVVTPPSVSEVRTWNYDKDAPTLKKGEEMGRFNMGSTIIVLFGKDMAQWEQSLVEDKAVQMGELIGKI
ncbi:MAG: phosphatidylserine decarboxylase [Methylococcales bacterium]|nr:phosphatidylserine decarboxylase [Methylococcales bacterium]